MRCLLFGVAGFALGVVTIRAWIYARLSRIAQEQVHEVFREDAEKLRVARLAIFRVLSGKYHDNPEDWAAFVRKAKVI